MRRVWVVFGSFLLAYGFIIFRLFYWQVVASDSLRSAAAAQYFLQFPIPATRGTIIASDAKPLVMNQAASLVYATPKDINDTRSFSQQVSPILSLESKDVQDRISQPGMVWVPIARKVDREISDKLRQLNLKGLGLEKESKRYYAESSMAAQLLGFVGSDENGKDRGYFGLEGYYDRELRGKDGSLQVEKDVHGTPMLVGDVIRIEPENGRDLVLWLDRTVQYSTERRLREGIQKYGAKEGSVVVLDPKTGGVLAMASYPNYDPGIYTKFSREYYKNPIVASSYEPGSTFKVLIMAKALDENVITPNTEVDETEAIQVDKYFIKTWNDTYHGRIPMTKVLEYSSNVGMVFVQKKLGKDKLLSALHDFGIGQLTGIDLQDEATPELRDDRDWSEVDLATASFGQGIAVTPLQMLRAVSSLANDGVLMEPRVVKEIRDKKEQHITVPPKKVRQVIRPATAHVITEMMVAAVDNGEAKWAKPNGYRIAGKTGTAQIPVAGHYDEKKTIASFVGFAPADEPKFVMLVTLREPASSPWGSETAAPLFFTIARDLFSYYGISPR